MTQFLAPGKPTRFMVTTTMICLHGNAGADTLHGGNNDDILYGGAGGDTLNGDAGTDTASYTNASSGVTVDLTNTANNTGDAAGDTYK
jgi:Ca2+-binding RTX toxin-like protein